MEVSDKLKREVEKRSFIWQGTTVKITVSVAWQQRLRKDTGLEQSGQCCRSSPV